MARTVRSVKYGSNGSYSITYSTDLSWMWIIISLCAAILLIAILIKRQKSLPQSTV